MTSFSERPVERGLDAMLIVYSLLSDHPASLFCEQFIRDRSGSFTPTLTLFETRAVLTKVYSIDANLVSQKLTHFAAGQIVVTPVDIASPGLSKPRKTPNSNAFRVSNECNDVHAIDSFVPSR